jgi:hypothetical protein
MKTLLLICLIVAAAPVKALTWQELNQEILSVEQGNPANTAIIQRMSDITTALFTYHRAAVTAELATLFCPPEGGSMGLNEIVSIVRRQATEADVQDDYLVESLLLDGLQQRFPCSR